MSSSAGEADQRPAILVVEDELVLALELESAIEAAGFPVLGPAATMESAAALLTAKLPAAALLDVNLEGRSIDPFARRLRAAGVPFALHTAYTAAHLTTPLLRAAPLLPKPLERGALPRVLRALLAGG
ncbi:MAG: hypothetical protein GVY27_01785 [Deinococcus-Thermus bacterium]|jgi:DNA-binding response OmpR family regulator|nr:hypothetical protein [Deinococcota bacterium]